MRLRDGVIATSTEYGLVLLDEHAGEYWSLNPSGALVIKALLDGAGGDGAAQVLADRHDVDLASARADIDDVLAQLRAAGLVEVSAGSSR